MSYLSGLKVDNVATGTGSLRELKDEGNNKTVSTISENNEKAQKEQGNSETKNDETATNASDFAVEGEISLHSAENPKDASIQDSPQNTEDTTAPPSDAGRNEVKKNVPTTSTSLEVDSQPPSSQRNVTGRLLIKRRSSRIDIARSKTAIEEVDSAAPRSAKKRKTKKRMVALFLESEYPRK